MNPLAGVFNAVKEKYWEEKSSTRHDVSHEAQDDDEVEADVHDETDSGTIDLRSFDHRRGESRLYSEVEHCFQLDSWDCGEQEQFSILNS